jgi:hypothetical protein
MHLHSSELASPGSERVAREAKQARASSCVPLSSTKSRILKKNWSSLRQIVE